MQELIIQDLDLITDATTAPMVSIYLSRSTEEDLRPLAQKWKHSLSKVENLLLKDYTRSFVHSFMEPLKNFDVQLVLGEMDKGVIVFYSTDLQGFMRVQAEIGDLVVVADSFHIKPVLRIRNNERGFFVVTINPAAVTLSLESNGHFYRLDVIRNPAASDDSGVFKSKRALKDFYSHSSIILNETLGYYKLPALLVGKKDDQDQMRKYLKIDDLLDEGLYEDPEILSKEELRRRCFKILEPYYHRKEAEALYEFKMAIGNNLVVTYLEDIALSAVAGKIEKLFVVEGQHVWGRINQKTGEISISPRQENSRDDDILDDIAEIVLSQGGEVVVLKNSSGIDGHLAAAVVRDTLHLYEYHQSFLSSGM